MKIIIEDTLKITYTLSSTRQGLMWKRGTRRADSIEPDMVYNYLLSESIRLTKTNVRDALIGDQAKAKNIIQEWFTAKEAEQARQAQDDEFNINQYIDTKFNETFNVDEDMNITLKGVIGKSHYQSTSAADVVMGIADRDLNNVPFGIERVRRCITQNTLRHRERSRHAHLVKVKFEKEYPKFVDGWITKLFDLYGIESNELHLTMFKHMLYSIKRAVYGLPPDDCRFMYSFFSRRQGLGKSRFVEHTCDPFSFLFTDQGTIDMLVKKNDLKALISTKSVIDIQELASEGEFDRSSYAAMKAAITSKSVGGRVLYTTDNEEIKNYAVFLSSTNLHIADVVKDDTGLRRFFSFDFGKKRSDMDWDEVDAHWKYIDRVYRYINEEGPAPLNDKMEIFAELETVQESYQRRTDIFAEWQTMSGNKLVVKKTKTSREISKTELFNFMREYCKTYESFNLKMGTMKSLLISRHNIFPHKDNDGCDMYWMEVGNISPLTNTKSEIASLAQPVSNGDIF